MRHVQRLLLPEPPHNQKRSFSRHLFPVHLSLRAFVGHAGGHARQPKNALFPVQSVPFSQFGSVEVFVEVPYKI